MRPLTFRHLERIVVLLAVVLYLYAAFTLSAQPKPDGVSGAVAILTESCSNGEATVSAGQQPISASGSLTKANPETPPFCDQTRHNMYLDVPNTREETRNITNSARSLDNQTTDPCRRPNGQRAPKPGHKRAVDPSKLHKAQNPAP